MAQFRSVLGGAEAAVPFSEAVLNGWAPDGGMYWPTAIEPVEPATLAGWASLSYPRLCEEVLKRFIPADDPDITPTDLAGIVSTAFAAFGDAEVVSLRPLSDGLHVAELWHGPTLAFKDLGMSVLGRVLSNLLLRRRERLTLLVGTSGDTGSSAMEAVRGLDGIDILVLYPLQAPPAQVSPRPPPPSATLLALSPRGRASPRSRPCRRSRWPQQLPLPLRASAVRPAPEDGAPSASLDCPKAQAAPTHPGAPPERLGSSLWPSQPASGLPKAEDSPPFLSRCRRSR